ncbi:hypothetical protein [Nocardia carnea]|nr:hypothetical protein [Nocardia carnea]
MPIQGRRPQQWRSRFQRPLGHIRWASREFIWSIQGALIHGIQISAGS